MSGSSPFDLSGRVALVTGGNGGLGLAMARALHEAGARVVVTGRDAEKNAAAAREFDTRVLDVTDGDAVVRLFAALERETGGVDVLVNNAGIYLDDPVLGSTVDAGLDGGEEGHASWTRMVEVNLSGPLRCARAAARRMRGCGAGKIINVGSVYSTYGHPMSAGYAATKAGVVGLTRSLAVELGPYGIQANAILPGWFPTVINGDLPAQPRGEEIRRRTPAGRWGADRDLAGVVVFLAAPASDFINGVAIAVDGGYQVTDRFVHA